MNIWQNGQVLKSLIFMRVSQMTTREGCLKSTNWNKQVYCPCDSKETAKKIEKICINCGMQGDTGGGNEESVWVYCYAITKSSIEHT